MPDLSDGVVSIAATASDSVGQHAAGRRPRVERVDVPPLPRSDDLYLFHRGLQYPAETRFALDALSFLIFRAGRPAVAAGLYRALHFGIAATMTRRRRTACRGRGDT